MHTSNILFPEQSGFREGSLTENAAFKLTESVLKYINQKMHVGGIFCDLAKEQRWPQSRFGHDVKDRSSHPLLGIES
jgi:hypothetical protein